MMKKNSIAAGTLALALCVSLDSTKPAQAQGVRRPTVSPYLNLLRNDATPAENYYNLVRPEFLFRQSLQTQGRQIQRLQRGSTNVPSTQTGVAPSPTAIPGTGHSTYYQTFSHYYYFAPTTRGR